MFSVIYKISWYKVIITAFHPSSVVILEEKNQMIYVQET